MGKGLVFFTFLQREDPSLPALAVGGKHVEDVAVMDNLERGTEKGTSHEEQSQTHWSQGRHQKIEAAAL